MKRLWKDGSIALGLAVFSAGVSLTSLLVGIFAK